MVKIHPAVAKANTETAAQLASFLSPVQRFKDNTCTIQVAHSSDLQKDVRYLIWDILEQNMRSLYTNSSFGWNPPAKKREIFHRLSRFILFWSTVPDDAEAPRLLAYSMFRFERENKRNVVYCYEMQVIKAARRMGLGKMLMNCLGCVGSGVGMCGMMLTVFEANVDAIRFYSSLGFLKDPSSPGYRDAGDEGYDDEDPSGSYDYRILSKTFTTIS